LTTQDPVPPTPSSLPPPSAGLNRAIFAMAWPVVCAFALINVLEIIDLWMSKALGEDATAAVVFGSRLMHVPQSIIFAVGAACVALMARANAAGDMPLARRGLVGATAVSFGVTVAFAVTVVVFPGPVLTALNAKPGVIVDGVSYVRLLMAASVLLSIAHMLESAHRSRRDTFTPLAIVAFAACFKVGLNTVLMPSLGLTGAGLATVGAHSTALASYVIIGRLDSNRIRRRRATVTAGPLLPTLSDMRGVVTHARSAWQIAAPAVGERVLMSLALLAYFSILGSYGTAAVVAYGWGVQALAYSWLPGIGAGVAASALVGQALGAGDRAGARRAAGRATLIALSFMTVLGTISGIFRHSIAAFFTSDPLVVEELTTFFFMLAIAQPFMAIHFTLAGALRGAGDTVTPMWASATGNWMLRVPLAALAAFVFDWPVIVVWAALISDHVVRSIWLGIAFFRGRWSRNVGAVISRVA
jgi:putative MATE family efflux protein